MKNGQRNPKSVVLICLGIPRKKPCVERIENAITMVRQILGGHESHYCSISEQAFLVDQDDDYPLVIELLEHCRTFGVLTMVSELNDQPILLSTEHQEARAFLERRGYHLRRLPIAHAR